MCGWIGNGILARAPIRPKSAWKAFGVIGAPRRQQSWRDRAREIRSLGDQMHDQLAKDEMLRLANKYERLADWTEDQARHSSAIP
jgi:hypothetical protein